MKIVISVNSTWNLLNFRAGLINGLIANGHEVIAFAPCDQYARRVEGLGCRVYDFPMNGMSQNPINNLVLLYRYIRAFLLEKPDAYLSFTIKPTIFGSMAAHFTGVPVINNIAGLGVVFEKNNWLTRLVQLLYKVALFPSRKVFFQNKDDMELFLAREMVRIQAVDLVPGSGIDVDRFNYSEERLENVDGWRKTKRVRGFRFLLVARMLWTKGIGEYVQAANVISRQYSNVEFGLLGFVDVQNPHAITQNLIDEWHGQGSITYLGVTDDVRQYLQSSDCVVLPSYYREGVPRSLLEAAAIGRPIITTNWVGCKEAVTDGVSGYLCEPKDSNDLIEKMRLVLDSEPEKLVAMGAAGRAKIKKEFDEKVVIYKYLSVIGDIQSTV